MTYKKFNELKGKCLQKGDIVFLLDLDYEVKTNHLSYNWENDKIFVRLGLDKSNFCSKHYGCIITDGVWPNFKPHDYEAATRCVLALFKLIEKLPEDLSIDKQIVTESNWKIGDKVVRGRDWGYYNQDKGSVYGIIKSKNSDGWINVSWIDENGNGINTQNYRTGKDDKYDLYFYEDSNKKTDKTEQTISINVKNLIKNEVCRNARTISPGPRIIRNAIQGRTDKVAIGQRCSLNSTRARKLE
jgi:hypothetical protein